MTMTTSTFAVRSRTSNRHKAHRAPRMAVGSDLPEPGPVKARCGTVVHRPEYLPTDQTAPEDRCLNCGWAPDLQPNH